MCTSQPFAFSAVASSCASRVRPRPLSRTTRLTLKGGDVLTRRTSVAGRRGQGGGNRFQEALLEGAIVGLIPFARGGAKRGLLFRRHRDAMFDGHAHCVEVEVVQRGQFLRAGYVRA